MISIPGSAKLDQIQVLRAYAALAVVLEHTLFEIDKRMGTVFRENLWFNLGSGVDLFFVISGFIMVYVSANHFGNAGNRPSFLYRRITRITPIYWVYTSLMLAVILLAPQLAPNVKTTVEHTIASYLFMPWPDAEGRLGPILGIGWTLLYEMMFYLVFACFIGLKMWRAVGAITLVFSVLLAARLIWGEALPFWLDYWSAPIIFEFVAGAAIGAIFLSTTWRGSWIIGAAIVAFSFAWYIAAHQITAFAELDRLIRLGVPSALIVFAFLFCTRGIGEKVRWPSWLVGLGDSSYSLYLSHFFTIGACYAVLSAVGLLNVLPPLGWLPMVMLACVIVGVVSYELIERPALKIARHWEPRIIRRRPQLTGA